MDSLLLKNVILTPRQSEVLDLVKNRTHQFLFVSGEAGTGKSFTLKVIIDMLRAKGECAVVLAPTGIASQNIGGQTFMSFFNIYPEDTVTKSLTKKRNLQLWQESRTIIIDEVSMLRPDLFDLAIEKMLRYNIDVSRIRWVFVGDMGQLKAIVKAGDGFDRATYNDATIFSSKYATSIHQVNLDQVHRQKNQEYIKALNLLRDNVYDYQYWSKFVRSDVPDDRVFLAFRRDTVKSVNTSIANRSNMKNKKFNKTVFNGKYDEANCPVGNWVSLADGLRVMYLINSNTGEFPRFNGMIGNIYLRGKKWAFVTSKGEAFNLELHRFENKEYEFCPETWTERVEDENGDIDVVTMGPGMRATVVGYAENYPIMQADAITIHKSQGSQFEQVTVCRTQTPLDLLYVGFSRCTGPEGLVIYDGSIVEPKVTFLPPSNSVANRAVLDEIFEALDVSELAKKNKVREPINSFSLNNRIDVYNPVNPINRVVKGSTYVSPFDYLKDLKAGDARLNSVSPIFQYPETFDKVVGTEPAATIAPINVNRLDHLPFEKPDILIVDGGCTKAGSMEYRGVSQIGTEYKQVFYEGVIPGGTSNISEFLAICVGLEQMEKNGYSDIKIYSDSMVAIKWVIEGYAATKSREDLDENVLKALMYFEGKLYNKEYKNKVYFWRKHKMGDNVADLGNKGNSKKLLAPVIR